MSQNTSWCLDSHFTLIGYFSTSLSNCKIIFKDQQSYQNNAQCSSWSSMELFVIFHTYVQNLIKKTWIEKSIKKSCHFLWKRLLSSIYKSVLLIPVSCLFINEVLLIPCLYYFLVIFILLCNMYMEHRAVLRDNLSRWKIMYPYCMWLATMK